MKPTSPEDREIEEMSADVSARYRAAANDEPSSRVDAAISEAAQREAGRPRFVRNWQMPAAVAAVLVIGVSLSLMTRVGVDSLPPLDQSPDKGVEMAKPAAPSLEMQVGSAPKRKLDLQSRPSRERSERADREAKLRPGEDSVASQAAGTAQSEPPDIAAPPPPSVRQFDPSAAVRAPSAGEPVAEEAPAGSADENRAKSLRREVPPASAARPQADNQPPEQWLRAIEDLLKGGKDTDARAQLAEFRKRYPDYRLPETLQAFEREPSPAPK